MSLWSGALQQSNGQFRDGSYRPGEASNPHIGRIVQNIGRIVQRFDHSVALSLELVK
jgi:hypothetical protein